MGNVRKRKTIGFISQTGFDNFPTQMLGGAVKAARAHDVNLIRFTTESTRLEDAYRDQLDYILRIIADTELDGLMFLGWMTGIQTYPGAFIEKVRKIRKLPLLSAGCVIDGVPSVAMDGARHIVELLEHLTETHGRTKIVFIQPYSPDERYPAYEDYMRTHGLFNPELVITREEILIRGDHYARIRAKKICSILFDERKLDFDAVISPFAHEAAGIVEESIRRGRRIPQDFAVIGWEDGERSKYSDPPITSLYFPFFEIGQAACERMIRIISGETAPRIEFVPAKLTIRRSCGCTPEDVLNRRAELPHNRMPNPTKSELVRRLRPGQDLAFEALDPAVMLDILFEPAEDSENIPRYLNRLLEGASITIHSINLINMIQKDALKFSCFIHRECGDETLAWKAERIAYRMLMAINQKTERELGFNEALNRGESHLLQGINQHIVTTFGFEELLKAITESLERINIKNCYLFLNSDPGLAAGENRSVYKFQNGIMGDITGEAGEKCDLSRLLFPEDRQIVYYFYILHIQQKLIGFLALEPHQIDEQIYYSLSVQISSALYEAGTMRNLEKTIGSLETARNTISANLTLIQQKTSELEESNRKLSRLDRLKNDFITNVTHDFRSPLMVILNLAELSINFYNEMDDRMILDRLETIFKASMKLSDTVDRLLEIARMDAEAIELHIRQLPLRASVKDIGDFYKSAAAASGIVIDMDLPDQEIDDFYTDPEKLDAIINNIISNAVKFVDPLRGKISVKVVDGKHNVYLIVEDNGIGIPPDKLETIFNRFEQLSGGRAGRPKGSGIGLAFARQTAKALMGNLKAESEGPGKGARFILEFPKGIETFKHATGKVVFELEGETPLKDKSSRYRQLVEAGLRELRERPGVQVILNRAEPNQEMILVIDDDPAITEIVKEYLSRAGYANFIIASYAADGLEMVDRFKPDLIISDCNIVLPNGREFHEELLQNQKTIGTPIIFLSSRSRRKLTPAEEKRGAFVYLQKPVDGRNLLANVERLLSKKS